MGVRHPSYFARAFLWNEMGDLNRKIGFSVVSTVCLRRPIKKNPSSRKGAFSFHLTNM